MRYDRTGRSVAAMTITVGSVWVGTQAHHKWVVRVRKVMPHHLLVEVIAGPSGHRNTLMKFTTSHFLAVYTPRVSPEKPATP
jgi:hypothetical protein